MSAAPPIAATASETPKGRIMMILSVIRNIKTPITAYRLIMDKFDLRSSPDLAGGGENERISEACLKLLN
jgi:hypothetical protein